jgi:[protein-PII] uridylyltransferase
MTIMDSRIVPLEKGYSIDSFVFMELDDRVEIDEARMIKIRRSLTRVLTAYDDNAVTVTRTLPRQARMFTTQATVDFGPGTSSNNTVLEIVAADRPGLLSQIGQVFVEQEVDIEAAKIMTIGERAEDVFYISDESGKPLDEDAQDKLQKALLAKLGGNLKLTNKNGT